MTELRRFLTAPKSQKLTLTLPMDYIQKKSFYAMCSPETKALMDGLEKLIDDATSDYTTAESWPTIMAVVDKLNSLTDNEVCISIHFLQNGDTNLDKLLTLNDAIQAAHNMFVAATSSQVASSPRRKHKPDRDEAEDNAVMSPKKAPRGADVMSKANVPDDDPFAAFAQERVRKQQSVVLNTAESTHPVPVAAASDAQVAAPAVVVQDLISWDDRDEVVARAACGVMAGHAPPPRNPFDAFVLAVPPPRRTTSTNPFDLI
ncbi:hypothetical protein DYB32_010217 [Aphanomyces invadans]|uniref:GAT domain-containing protein n=1 Tax=Aphanomyces invadans TaxID=157072 RepID=A0A418AGP0_9STRA|nr:hypothetical protein DYB32_010217 [Aphanomyces invadans]